MKEQDIRNNQHTSSTTSTEVHPPFPFGSIPPLSSNNTYSSRQNPLDKRISISATTSPPTLAERLPHLVNDIDLQSIHYNSDSSGNTPRAAVTQSHPTTSGSLLSHAELHSVLLAAVSAQLSQEEQDQQEQHHHKTEVYDTGTPYINKSDHILPSPSMRTLSLSQASSRANSAMMSSMYPSVSSSMMPPADRGVENNDNNIDIDLSGGSSEESQQPQQQIRKLSLSSPSSSLYKANISGLVSDPYSSSAVFDEDDDDNINIDIHDKENVDNKKFSRSGHATPNSSKALSRSSSTASGFQTFKAHQVQQQQQQVISPTSAAPITAASSGGTPKHLRRRSSAAHPRSPSPAQPIASTGRRSRPNSSSGEGHLAKHFQQQQQTESTCRPNLSGQLQDGSAAPSTSLISSSRLSGLILGHATRHHRRASRQLFYQVDDSAIVDTTDERAFASSSSSSTSSLPAANLSNDDQDADNEGPYNKLQRRNASSSSSTSLSKYQQQQQAQAAPGTPTSKTKSPSANAGSTTPHAHHDLKGRRSRRGSGSSTRHRNSMRASQSNASTPRSRRTSMKQRESELNLAQLHHSLTTADSSLSIRSDDTLSPSSFNPHDEPELVKDSFSSIGNGTFSILSPPTSARGSHAFDTGRSLVITLVKIKDFAFPPHDPRFIGDVAPPTPISIPESENAYNNWVSPNALNGQDAVGPYGQQQDGLQCDPSPSLSLLSSSSSSSLSSGFTPPPLGAFGYGHHYNYSGAQQPQASGLTRHQQSGPLQLPPGGSWSTWGATPENPSDQPFSNGVGASSGAPSNSNLAWNFVTDHGPSPFTDLPTTSSLRGGVPNNLLGSALHIQDFDEDFDEDDDEDFTDRVMYDGGAVQDDHTSAATVGPADDANQASFSNLPAGGLFYRVQYSFTAEASQEMDIIEGGKSFVNFGNLNVADGTLFAVSADIIRVWQQLEDGWVVGAKLRRIEGSGSHLRSSEEVASGLIPQSYLVLCEELPVSTNTSGVSAHRENTIPASPSMLQEP